MKLSERFPPIGNFERHLLHLKKERHLLDFRETISERFPPVLMKFERVLNGPRPAQTRVAAPWPLP
jgi:hypothetical protein